LSYIISLKKGYGGNTKRGSIKEIGIAFLRSLWGLFAPVIILGGIYGGMFTPTEAAAVAAAYGIIVGMFIYKAIDFKSLMNLLIDAAVSSSIIMIIVMNASVFAWLLTTGRVAQSVFSAVTDFTINPIFILIMINIFLLIAGCFMDAISAYYIFIPLFLPICKEVGIDPIHLGIIMTVNLAIGLITPPVGVDLYTACSISGITLKDISTSIWPFVLAAILGLIIITYIPAVSLLLPTILGMR
jgi:C4-dicarboxylate transporter DctM subunit